MKIVVSDTGKLKELIIKSGFSIRGFGRKIGISSGYVVQVCNGNRNPSPEVAKKITDALGVGFDEIFFILSACKSEQNKSA